MGKKGKARDADNGPRGPGKWLIDAVAPQPASILAGAPVFDKHRAYQESVQTPAGDISYLSKFFLEHVRGRLDKPLHLREDFCGTAYICATWLAGDVRRTALGVDLDEDALRWGAAHNAAAVVGAAGRLELLVANVLDDLAAAPAVPLLDEPFAGPGQGPDGEDDAAEDDPSSSPLRSRPADIIAALNYSTCCLLSRPHLVAYMRRVRAALHPDGGLFCMDLYGGAASEVALTHQRRMAGGYTYMWEQDAFDALTRRTRASISFKIDAPVGGRAPPVVLRRAFTYEWRLWTVPEVREAMAEAGLASHVWCRRTPVPGRHGDQGQDDEGQEDRTKEEEQEEEEEEELPRELTGGRVGWGRGQRLGRRRGHTGGKEDHHDRRESGREDRDSRSAPRSRGRRAGGRHDAAGDDDDGAEADQGEPEVAGDYLPAPKHFPQSGSWEVYVVGVPMAGR